MEFSYTKIKYIVTVFFFLFPIHISSEVVASEVLYIGSQTPTHMNIRYEPFYKMFTKQTSIKVIRVRLDDIKLLDDDKYWYGPNGKPLDIINGQVTQRLLAYYQQGKLTSLNHYWQTHPSTENFSHLKGLITYDKQVLALPYSIYSWQIFYSKNAFGPNIKVPKTFDELLGVCQQLSAKDIVPFHVMNKTAWSQMAWFQYLVLRIHGLSFYNQLANGDIAYTSQEVVSVMQSWKKLVDANCFSNKYGDMKWREALPFLLRDKIAMVFTGPTLIHRIKNEANKHKVSFFTFPKVKNIPRYEVSPMNAFHVSALSHKTESIYKFLDFMSHAHIQEDLTHPISSLPANKSSSLPSHPLGKEISNVLLKAAGTANFFDRQVPPEFEKAARSFFTEFTLTGDIEHFVKNMEILRLRHYKKHKVDKG